MRNCAGMLLALCLVAGVRGEQATVAVAANFAWPMAELETRFEAGRAHELTIVTGSTGQLYAQIVNGAPYDVFLAADRERPLRLAEDDRGDAPFTYALGRLALWTREQDYAGNLTVDTLKHVEFRHLAIANPRLAPYGAAARETLQTVGLWDALQSRIVLGENIGQAFAMVETRNAELGLVALSAALVYPGAAGYAPVPPGYHQPIRQDAMLLARGRDNPAAQTFLNFLREPEARRIIEQSGYELP